MVYVPANSEREDGPRAKTDSTWSLFSAYRKQKGEKGENKKKPAAASGPLNMAGAQPVPIIMRPTVTTPGGTVVVVTQPTTTTPGGTMVVVQPTGEEDKGGVGAKDSKEKGDKDKEKDKDDEGDDKPPRGGKYVVEKYFGICSCIVSTCTGCVCAPCIYLCCPCDVRTVYIADGQRYSKLGCSFSCGGCGCCCW